MARQTYTAALLHTTDAEYRTWGAQLSAALVAIGLVATADTGQVNWTTVLRPGTNTYSYEIYKFPDALNATKGVYLKVEYGTGTTATNPSVRFTVGTGSNGSGTLTNVIQAATASFSAAPLGGAVSTYASYKDGAFALAWGVNGGSASCPRYVIVVDRSRDSAGATTGNALYVLNQVTSTAAGMVQYTWSYDSSTLVANATPPGSLTPPTQAFSSSQAIVNLYNHQVFSPDVYNVIGVLTYLNAEIAAFAEIDIAPVGAVSHHYICLGATYAVGGGAVTQTFHSIAILYET